MQANSICTYRAFSPGKILNWVLSSRGANKTSNYSGKLSDARRWEWAPTTVCNMHSFERPTVEKYSHSQSQGLKQFSAVQPAPPTAISRAKTGSRNVALARGKATSRSTPQQLTSSSVTESRGRLMRRRRAQDVSVCPWIPTIFWSKS